MATSELKLVEIEPDAKYEVRFRDEVLSKESDYYRACEEFEAWKNYFS